MALTKAVTDLVFNELNNVLYSNTSKKVVELSRRRIFLTADSLVSISAGTLKFKDTFTSLATLVIMLFLMLCYESMQYA